MFVRGAMSTDFLEEMRISVCYFNKSSIHFVSDPANERGTVVTRAATGEEWSLNCPEG